MTKFNEEEWNIGRYAAIDGRRYRLFASQAWKRGYRHGKRERRALEAREQR